MTFGDTTVIGNLVGNKTIKNSAGTDITSTVLTNAVTLGDARVILETGVDSWSSQDAVYGSVQQASNYFGASDVEIRYGDDKEKSFKYYQIALDICSSLAKSTAQAVVVVTKDYKSFPLNPDATPYRSVLVGDSGTLSG